MESSSSSGPTCTWPLCACPVEHPKDCPDPINYSSSSASPHSCKEHCATSSSCADSCADSCQILPLKADPSPLWRVLVVFSVIPERVDLFMFECGDELKDKLISFHDRYINVDDIGEKISRFFYHPTSGQYLHVPMEWFAGIGRIDHIVRTGFVL